MWTPATRGRMAAIERKTKRYPTDLTDEEWAKVEPLLPRRSKRGRPREVDLREIMNAIRYLVRTGCGWRMLPNDFPPWETVYWWFRRFVRQLLFRTIHDLALMPSAASCCVASAIKRFSKRTLRGSQLFFRASGRHKRLIPEVGKHLKFYSTPMLKGDSATIGATTPATMIWTMASPHPQRRRFFASTALRRRRPARLADDPRGCIQDAGTGTGRALGCNPPPAVRAGTGSGSAPASAQPGLRAGPRVARGRASGHDRRQGRALSRRALSLDVRGCPSDHRGPLVRSAVLRSKGMTAKAPVRRCAVYTRKSSEEGLEQDLQRWRWRIAFATISGAMLRGGKPSQRLSIASSSAQSACA